MSIIDKIKSNSRIDLTKNDLFNHAVFHEEIQVDRNCLFKYIAFMYTDDSPYLYEDFVKTRKLQAAKDAGFEFHNGKFDASIELMLASRDDNVNRMIVQYCKQQRRTKFTKLVLSEEVYYNLWEDLLGERKNEKSKQLIDSVNELEIIIEKTRRELLNNDDSEEIEKTLYEAVDEAELGLSPEEIADKHDKKN